MWYFHHPFTSYVIAFLFFFGNYVCILRREISKKVIVENSFKNKKRWKAFYLCTQICSADTHPHTKQVFTYYYKKQTKKKRIISRNNLPEWRLTLHHWQTAHLLWSVGVLGALQDSNAQIVPRWSIFLPHLLWITGKFFIFIFYL